ncbi:hypothetical protein XELAEV_18021754mg [Xenopus laevis]|uniref:Protein kinase C-binding protein NELL1 n=1 Tax=Xenopus laevis TaxID=8355 RepID=A0A974HMI0_XENLA|nr:hypothetical protein XELAEV_18021754mg [Xenopus laevis]
MRRNACDVLDVVKKQEVKKNRMNFTGDFVTIRKNAGVKSDATEISVTRLSDTDAATSSDTSISYLISVASDLTPAFLHSASECAEIARGVPPFSFNPLVCRTSLGIVLGLGTDPDLQIDVITELELVNSTRGVTQVFGVHNGSKAFLFQDGQREIHAAPHMSEKVIQLFRNKSEFTFLASIQQRSSTSGVILSIREMEHSFFELESSGLRDEIRYHYRFNGKSRTEAFPYRLADGQWHKIALTVSASHVLLHVDCNRIYERVIDPPDTNLSPGSSLWLGQRNRKHGFFKGVIQDVKIIFMPNGYITQCPNLNRTCPTCSDFLSLVQGIMDLQELLAKMTAKLNYAESRLGQLENCHCEKTCQVREVIYRDKDSWVEDDHCRNCTCKNGAVECRRMLCPPLNCSSDSLPVHIAGQCCKVCRPKCIYGGRELAEGDRILAKSCRECKNGALQKLTEPCPSLNCSETDRVLPENQCCSVCRGHNFCADGHRCGENSECRNRNTKATCECLSGFQPIQGDPAYCEGYSSGLIYRLLSGSSDISKV